MTEEQMKLMSESGCFYVDFGLESGSKKLLKKMRKSTNLDKIVKNLKLASRYFQKTGATFILGYPGENDETIQETLAFRKSVPVTRASFFFLNPYPGTQVYDECRNKIIERYGNESEYFKELSDAQELTINLTDHSDEWLLAQRKQIIEEVQDHLRPLWKKIWVRIQWRLQGLLRAA